jgi:hypothetical protein
MVQVLHLADRGRIARRHAKRPRSFSNTVSSRGQLSIEKAPQVTSNK